MKMLLQKLSQVKSKKILVLSALNSLLLVCLTIAFQNFLVAKLQKGKPGSWGNFVKNVLLKSDTQIDPKRFLFVNTSTSNALIENEQPPFDNSVITDRKKLASFLSYLKDNQQYKYLIVDIIFDSPSESDTILQRVVEGLPRLITCSFTNKKDEVIKPIFGVECGSCDIETLNGNFTEYKLISENGQKSLPLKVFETLHDTPQKNMLDIELNSFILNYRITKADINTAKYTLTDLSTLLFLGKDAIQNASKNRIVVIGDFKAYDKVSTSIGEIPGPLILVNVILSLENGDNIITIFKLFILFLGFFFLSFIAIYPEDLLNRMFSNISERRWYLKFFAESIGIGMLLGLCSTLYFIIFNIYLNIIYMGFYFLALNYISKNLRFSKPKLKKKKNKKLRSFTAED